MSDRTPLDLDDLAPRPRALDDAALDDLTGGFLSRYREGLRRAKAKQAQHEAATRAKAEIGRQRQAAARRARKVMTGLARSR